LSSGTLPPLMWTKISLISTCPYIEFDYKENIMYKLK
jgi:hypothetical protein